MYICKRHRTILPQPHFPAYPSFLLGRESLDAYIPDIKLFRQVHGWLLGYFFILPSYQFFHSHDFTPILQCRHLTPCQQRVDRAGTKTRGRISFHVRTDNQVGKFHVFLVFIHTKQIDNLRYHPGNRFQLILRHQIRLYIHADHDFRPKGPCHVCREIIQYAPVYQYPITRHYRRKRSRDSHTCPHRPHQISIGHHDLLPIQHVSSHASEGNGQFQKIQRIMMPDSQVCKKIIHVLSPDKPYRTTSSPFEGEGQHVFRIVLFLAERQIVTIHLIA